LEAGPVDARSDIYSLGATLWFALTGLVPHSGSTIEEIRDRQTRDDLPVEQLVARKVPEPIIKLLRCTLAVVSRSAAPASARELMESPGILPPQVVSWYRCLPDRRLDRSRGDCRGQRCL